MSIAWIIFLVGWAAVVGIVLGHLWPRRKRRRKLDVRKVPGLQPSAGELDDQYLIVFSEFFKKRNERSKK